MRREVWVDWLRVIACFMVMVVHSTEPFYLGGEGSRILTGTDAFWVSFFEAIVRCCVPVFVVASSYLQFPLHYTTGEFFRRRVTRIVVPFLIWTIVYAVIWGEPVQNFKDLLLNFNYAAGHLWFVYMLAGIYLIMPLLSPWAEKVGKRELRFFLLLFLFTTCIPFIRDKALGDGAVVLFGPGGLPMQGLFPLWGEASWNDFGTFYYMSGFVGFMLLGLYLRKFVGQLSVGKTLAVALPCLVIGWVICGCGFCSRILQTANGVFPIEGGVGLAVGWEIPLTYCSFGVVLTTVGTVLLIRLIKAESWFYRNLVLPVSRASYGMYLCHMIALAAYSGLFRSLFGVGNEGAMGVMTTPVEILLTAVSSYLTVALVSVSIQRIPKVGKWIMG